MARDYDCPLVEAQVNWLPIHNSELPPVEVVGRSLDDDQRYESSWGACNREFAKATAAEKIEMLLAQFVYITVVDGMPVSDTHKAFSVIPEYRQALAKVGLQL